MKKKEMCKELKEYKKSLEQLKKAHEEVKEYNKYYNQEVKALVEKYKK